MTHAHRLLLKSARFLHVYLTLFGFVLLLFFAVTGFMLNHEDLFSSREPERYERTGIIPTSWLQPDKEDRLAVVEKLRKDFAVRGELDMDSFKFQNESADYRLVFKSPGYTAIAVIQSDDGQTTVTHETYGIVGLALDLHRGKSSGPEWSLVIDGVSILFVIVSITGLILWSSLKSRARHGLLVLTIGLALGVAVYFVYVPR